MGRVVGVTFAPPASVAVFAHALDLDIPILCDPAFATYAVFGFGKTSWTALLHVRYWRRLLTALRRGRRFGRPQEDVRQLGGDAVLDATQRLTWIFRSRFPADRPSVDEVRRRLADAASGG